MTTEIDTAGLQMNHLANTPDLTPSRLAGRQGNDVLRERGRKLAAFKAWLAERTPNDARTALLADSALALYRQVLRAQNSRQQRGKVRGSNANGVAAAVNALLTVLAQLKVLPEPPAASPANGPTPAIPAPPSVATAAEPYSGPSQFGWVQDGVIVGEKPADVQA